MTTLTTPKSVKNDLPTPYTRPDADLVLYDGKCKFCLAQVARLNRFDTGERLAFLSLHDPMVGERWPDLTYDQLMAEMYIVDRAGNRYHGAGAFRYLSRRMPALWWLAPMLHIPFSLPLWSWAYRQIANRRYLIAGKVEDCDGGTCGLHFGDVKK